MSLYGRIRCLCTTVALTAEFPAHVECASGTVITFFQAPLTSTLSQSWSNTLQYLWHFLSYLLRNLVLLVCSVLVISWWPEGFRTQFDLHGILVTGLSISGPALPLVLVFEACTERQLEAIWRSPDSA